MAILRREKRIRSEWLPDAQGDDVVSGTRTPLPLTRGDRRLSGASMQNAMPETCDALAEVCCRIERGFGDVQDVEFTVERGALHVLQTRPAKRTPEAALRIAVELAEEGVRPCAGCPPER